MRNFIVLDTETTGLEKPYCYNIGWVIQNVESGETIERSFVVEQIWHNTALFNTAYYADKRPIYVAEMRAKKTIMDKWGYIMGQLRRDIKNYDVEAIYAYNSAFDEKVINFNSDWFKTINPLDTTPIYDIWAMAQNFIVDNQYKAFCEENKYFSESGGYKTSAEVMYRYLSKNTDFIEDHTALADSIIELQILVCCLGMGAELNKAYPLQRSIKRDIPKHLKIKKYGEIVFETDFYDFWSRKDHTEIRLK